MNTFPTLYTPRLILRKIDAADIPALLKYANNKKISDYVLNIPHPYQEPDAVFRISYVWQGFKQQNRFVFAIILKDNEELIGEVGLHLDNNKQVAQLAYWVGEPFWGKGMATEAVKAVLRFGFQQLNLQQIFADCKQENTASVKVLTNNGMINDSMTGSILQYYLTQEAYKSL
ncbi:GNAT family N-acetyltransferase [Chitinophaga qingshengii]|uniref:GNAT family N-acetyltransferase n=1 Tax=Chitinophaga qingshengii TaxID=1569794 RepID=A0ABR7TRB9_9BACT|nr:GNAT family N-acetyltransferase [Chitinophaga qingshengii]MBC9932550.1 GNAT family N-acetyltransferase [Chitinophaga qingshengii]